MNLLAGKTVLTDRDIELFSWINEQKIMVSSQIYQIFWPQSEVRSGTARQRLTKLEESGYIKTMISEDKKRETKIKLFLLTEKGMDELRRRNLDHGFSEILEVNHVIVEHTLKLVNIRALFRELDQKNWRSERLIRKEDSRRGWFPDAILDIAGFKVAIEMENSFRDKELYKRRFQHYAAASEFSLAVFILSWPSVKAWIFDLDAPQDKVCFVNYETLLKKKGDSNLENKTSSIRLGSIL